MPHRPPIPAARLAEIWDESPTPIVLELLSEIHRLRSTIRRANQVRLFIGNHHLAVPSAVWECFERELAAEPCLTDPPTPRQRALVEESTARREAEKKRKA